MNDLEAIKKKMARFCAWRERCSFEAESKLKELGVTAVQVSKIMKWLTDEGYINDLRFAWSFASGKLEYNQWGKKKIKQELISRHIDHQNITEAIEKIDEEKYRQVAATLAQKKWNMLNDNDHYIRKQKTMAYLAGKGFENEIIFDVTATLHKEEKTDI